MALGHIEIPNSGIVHVVTRTLTAAQIISGEEVMLIPSPGVNKVVQFLHASFLFRPGTVPYAVTPGGILVSTAGNAKTVFDIATTAMFASVVPYLSTNMAIETLDVLSDFVGQDWFLSIQAPPPIALVQQATGTASASAAVTVTLGATPQDGNCLVLQYMSNNDHVDSITQTGATWVNVTSTGSNMVCETWVALNVSGAGKVVTINLGSSSGNGDSANVGEFSGIFAVNAVDKTHTNGGSSVNPSTGNTLATTVADELLIACAGLGSGSVTAGPTNGFTGMTQAAINSRRIVPSYKIVNATGTYGTDWTISPSADWDAAIISLKGSSGLVPDGNGSVTIMATYLVLSLD